MMLDVVFIVCFVLFIEGGKEERTPLCSTDPGPYFATNYLTLRTRYLLTKLFSREVPVLLKASRQGTKYSKVQLFPACPLQGACWEKLNNIDRPYFY
jgi:hypothetical protein